MPSSNRLTKLLRAAQRRAYPVLGGYLTAVLVGTHFPQALTGEASNDGSDKLVHLVAYAVLGFLVAMTMHRFSARLRVTRLLGGLALVMVFAAVDELTQPLPGINRTCDPLDWLADLAGAGLGHALYVQARHWGVLPPLERFPRGCDVQALPDGPDTRKPKQADCSSVDAG